MQIRIDTVFESYYQEMYRVIESMTRISVPIIDEYGKEYHFAPSRHFCAMRPRLLDGGVDAEEDVETLDFMLTKPRVERVIKWWAHATN